MRCKKCFHELGRISTLCPHCGDDNSAAVLSSVLGELVRLRGMECLSDGDFLVSAFRDLAPGLTKERRLLELFVKVNGHRDFLDCTGKGAEVLPLQVSRTAARMHNEYLIDLNLAKEFCSSFASAMAPGISVHRETPILPGRGAENRPIPERRTERDLKEDSTAAYDRFFASIFEGQKEEDGIRDFNIDHDLFQSDAKTNDVTTSYNKSAGISAGSISRNSAAGKKRQVLQPGMQVALGGFNPRNTPLSNQFNLGSVWKVLDVDIRDNTALLLFNNRHTMINLNIVHVPYHHKNSPVTWEKSEIRNWLNKAFYKQYIDDELKKAIAVSTLSNSDNAETGARGGRLTKDRVFLLSIDECRRYWQYCDDYPFWGIWWLRSPGYDNTHAAVVHQKTIDCNGGYVGTSKLELRPAIRINLAKAASVMHMIDESA